MANYTGVATRLRVKKTADKRLLEFLDYLYQTGSEREEQPPPQNPEQAKLNKDINTLGRMLVGGSAYFSTWEWRVKEDKGDYWLYESRASCSRCSASVFVSLVNGIFDQLVLEEGDILLRSVYEESSVELIVYFSQGEIKEDEGFHFTADHGCITDCRHPYRHKRSTHEEPWNNEVRHDDDCDLSWKFEELKALVAEEKKKRDADWHPWN